MRRSVVFRRRRPSAKDFAAAGLAADTEESSIDEEERLPAAWFRRWDSERRRWRARSFASRSAESSGSLPGFFLVLAGGSFGLLPSVVSDGGREDCGEAALKVSNQNIVIAGTKMTIYHVGFEFLF